MKTYIDFTNGYPRNWERLLVRGMRAAFQPVTARCVFRHGELAGMTPQDVSERGENFREVSGHGSNRKDRFSPRGI